MALPTSFTLPASRAGVGSVVVGETASKSYVVADVGVVGEGGTGSGSGGGGAPAVRKPITFVVS
jgi:hypothetical protein